MFEVEESEIVFKTTESPTDPPSPVPRSPPVSPTASADIQYDDVPDMIQKLKNELGLINWDNVEIKTVCNQLLQDNQARDQAIYDLTGEEEPGLSVRTPSTTGRLPATPHNFPGPDGR